MKYVVFKKSLHFISVELPDNFENSFEIICFETPEEFRNYLCLHSVKNHQSVLPDPTATGSRKYMNNGFFIRQNDYYRKISFDNILWVEASRSYCYIHVSGKRSAIIVSHPLADVKKKLPPGRFVQIHRSFIVSMEAVEKFIGNMLYIGETSFPIGKKYRKQVLDKFDFLDGMKNIPER